ncbi:MAG: SpoIID/LytB domain-containing protein [Oscillospiraceae bacterium]|nr:SpoIID/LytB domain-containing protein [Oscillospiraceae bacterium]
MGKRFMQVAVILAGLFAALVVSAAALSENPYVRIGLYYGSNAMTSANLENKSGYGSGYRFGFFDANYHFTQVGVTAQTQISMLKNVNQYLSNGTYTTSVPSGSYSVIGAYHVQLPNQYSSFSAAASAAARYTGGFPAYINGAYRVRVGSHTSLANAKTAASKLGVSGATAVGGSSTAVTVTKTKTTTILFQFDYGTTNVLAVRPGQNDSVKTITLFKNNQYYGSFQYRRISGGNLTVINVLPMEDYIKGVVPYEMSSSWPLEALKAQAVCARSYAARTLNKHKSYGFDLCRTSDCQVYYGTASATSTTNKAVDDTYNIYAWSGNSLCQTVYHSCDGGATESAENVWGNAIPYLVGVIDPYEVDIANTLSYYHWSATYTAAELTARLKEKGYSCSTIVNLYVAEWSNTGNPKKITFVDSNGKSYSFSGTNLVSIFNTAGEKAKSYRYKITTNASGGASGTNNRLLYVNPNGGTLSSLNGVYAISGSGTVGQMTGNNQYAVTGSGTEALFSSGNTGTTATQFTITGTGWGHNVGMSQWGAYCMAKRGYTYDQILKFYYKGITLK